MDRYGSGVDLKKCEVGHNIPTLPPVDFEIGESLVIRHDDNNTNKKKDVLVNQQSRACDDYMEMASSTFPNRSRVWSDGCMNSFSCNYRSLGNYQIPPPPRAAIFPPNYKPPMFTSIRSQRYCANTLNRCKCQFENSRFEQLTTTEELPLPPPPPPTQFENKNKSLARNNDNFERKLNQLIISVQLQNKRIEEILRRGEIKDPKRKPSPSSTSTEHVNGRPNTYKPFDDKIDDEVQTFDSFKLPASIVPRNREYKNPSTRRRYSTLFGCLLPCISSRNK